jgi:CRP/FNR family transcriptional regulator
MSAEGASIQRFLSGVGIFKRLTASEKRQLASCAREKRYAKGETIFRAGDPAQAVFRVKEGRVHLMSFLEGGQVSTTCVMTQGEPFCCLPALDRKPYPVDAIAAADSVAVQIPTEAFQNLLKKNPGFLQDALCLFCDRLRQVETRSCMIYDSVERRLAAALLSLSKKFGATIPLTRSELAEMASTTVESAIRSLSRLKGQGIIASSRGSLTILKAERLKELAGQ